MATPTPTHAARPRPPVVVGVSPTVVVGVVSPPVVAGGVDTDGVVGWAVVLGGRGVSMVSLHRLTSTSGKQNRKIN